jgi:type III secretion YscU/HrpY family protein
MSEKTEQPTPKKLREARKRGEVAKSRELGTAAVLLVAAGALWATGERLLGALTGAWDSSLAAIEGGAAAGPTAVLSASASRGLDAMAPLLAAVVAAGALASFLQVGPLATLEPVTPKLERIDPVRGFGRIFSQRQLVELLKTVAKLVIVGAVAWITLRDGLRGVVGLVQRDAEAAIFGTSALVGTLVLRVGAAVAAIAVLDVFYQRWRHLQDQKMTKEEVKREHKEAEGDPQAKRERQRMHREIAAHGVLESVRRADVLVVNPTHVAVALRYDEEAGNDAPEVLAKGQEELARRMIRAAEEAGVPVMREVPLARALFELEVGDEIPEALYEAVALVLKAAWAEREREEPR